MASREGPLVDTAFELLPAIDLRGGRVVRLAQGDFARETVYGDDPATVAETFVTAGARWLHVVDLDGARLGTPRQLEAVAAVVERVGERAAVEVSGGLRSDGAVAAALALGVARVVLGTAALRDADLVARLVARHSAARVAISLDVRDGRAVGEAWREGAADERVDAALLRLAEAGATTFEVTAIDRDGLLGGPDLDLYRRLVALGRGGIVASAGIRSIDDVRAVHDAGCSGAIVGRALYEGTLDLADAIRTVDRGRGAPPG